VSEFEAPKTHKIRDKSLRDHTIHGIRKTPEEERKEKKGAALGVCQWKDGYLPYQGNIWITNNEEPERELIRHHHNIPQVGRTGTTKTSELLQHKYYWRHMSDTIKQYVKKKTLVKEQKSFAMHHMAR